MRKPRKPVDEATKQKISQSLKGKRKGLKKAAIAGAGAAALAGAGALALRKRKKFQAEPIDIREVDPYALKQGAPLILPPPRPALPAPRRALPSKGQTAQVRKEAAKKYKSFETGRKRSNLMRRAGIDPKQGKALLSEAKGGRWLEIL